MGAAEPTRLARCPRCGYDQRGVIDTWNESCPLAGTCTECGLEFQWAEVLSEKIRRPRWCVEFADETSSLLQRSICTFLLTYWPWRFWKSLKMSHEIRWRRLAAYTLLVLVPLYGLFCLAQGVLIAALYGGTPGNVIHAMLLPLSSGRPTPLAPWATPWALYYDYWQDRIGPTATIFPLLHAFCAIGFITLPVSRRRAKVRWSHIVRITLYGLALVFLPVALPIVGTLIHALGYPFLGGLGTLLLWVGAALAIAILPLELVWWSTATGRYLKIPHAWGVGLAIVVMSFLATFLCLIVWHLN